MKISINPPKQVLGILKIFKKAKYEIYIVGGVVRDAILGKSLHDWDFTTNATPEQILILFPEGFYDNKYGTVGIKNAEERPIEITTFRIESGYTDKRHPDKISWAKTLEEDLKRRELTISAMALDNNFELKINNARPSRRNKLKGRVRRGLPNHSVFAKRSGAGLKTKRV